MATLTLVKRMKQWRILPPKDSEFYHLFDELGRELIDSCAHLNELFYTELPERGAIDKKIQDCLNRADEVSKAIEQLVRSAQQPPFDRAEINMLGARIQRVMRFIGHAANRYIIYEIPTADREMRELAPIILKACEHIDAALKELPGRRNIGPHCRAVDRLELEADIIYHGGLRRRFHEIREDGASLRAEIERAPGTCEHEVLLRLIEANVVYTRHVAVFFILRQVYAELERAIDACLDVTDALRQMVAEHV